MIGCLANAIFPARPGGFIRMYLAMKGAKINLASCFATILFERLFDILILSLISLIILIDKDFTVLVKFSILLLTIFSLATILFVIFYGNDHLKFLNINTLIAFLPKKIINILEDHFSSFCITLKLLQRRDILIKCGVLSILAWGFYSFGFFLLSLNFNLKSPTIAILLVVAFTNLASFIPLTPGSIGIFQFMTVIALSVWQVNVDLAFAFALCAQGMILSIQIILGFLSLLIENISLNKILSFK
jgi:uncharacterized protein (TIRG00374 family)